MTELSPTSPTRRPTTSRIPLVFTSPIQKSVRTPILLQLHLNQGFITTGWVGQPRHQVLRFVPVCSSNTPLTAADYYRTYASTILEALEWLLDVTHRRVLVCHDYGYSIPTACQDAVERILLHTAGAEAVSFHSTWWSIPAAVPVVHDALVIAVSLTGMHCFAYAAGHVLPFTFQSSIHHRVVLAQTSAAIWQQLQQESLTPLVTALLACLQACPRASRRAVVHNLWLVGSVVLDVPGYSKAIAKALKQRLEGKDMLILDQERDQQVVTEGEEDQSVTTTQLPIATKELQPLAVHVSTLVVDSSDLPWLGASRWAHQLHGVNPDAEAFQWKFAKSRALS